MFSRRLTIRKRRLNTNFAFSFWVLCSFFRCRCWALVGRPRRRLCTAIAAPREPAAQAFDGIENLGVEVLHYVEHTQLVLRFGPELNEHIGIQWRTIGDGDFHLQSPIPQVFQEPPHVVLVVSADQRESYWDVLERIRRQQQRVLAQMQLIDRQGARENGEHLLPMFVHLQAGDGIMETVVDETRGQIEVEVTLQAAECRFHVHAVVQDSVEDEFGGRCCRTCTAA